MSKPDLALKRPSELKKVEILEETVKTGTLEDLKAVLETYQPFEMTARALGLAARYRGLDFVRMLAEHGATFDYDDTSGMQSKYKMRQNTAAGSYLTLYYLMLVPEELDLSGPSVHACYRDHTYDYTPMNGIPYMRISRELEEKTLSLEQRIKVTEYISQEKRLDISLDDMLYWALSRDEPDFADALIKLGARLDHKAPTYYPTHHYYRREPCTYLETITSAKQSLYWNDYVTAMGRVKAERLLPVLERLHALAAAAGKKLAMSQKLFDELNWTDEALAFAWENMNCSKVDKKKALEVAVSRNAAAALGKMAEAGWLRQRQRREKLIEYAIENQYNEALAWLMDYKNRTVDLAAEEAKEEARLMKELSASPDSVAALKKSWGYKKQEDGTLVITSYKGNETEVVIPNRIGKAEVTAIERNAFSLNAPRLNETQKKVRAAITSVEFPGSIREIPEAMFYRGWRIPSPLKRVVLNEGIKVIGENAFNYCMIEEIVIPDSVRKIGDNAFYSCTKIEEIYIPDSVRKIGEYVFAGCQRLKKVRLPKGIRSLPAGMLDGTGIETFDIPESVRTIGHHAFSGCNSLTSVSFPNSLTEISYAMFSNCEALSDVRLPPNIKRIEQLAFYRCPIKEIVLPETVAEIGYAAFSYCKALRAISIPQSVTEIGNSAFADCETLRSVSVPKTTKLGREVFFGCSALSDEKGQIIVNGILFDNGLPWKDGLKPFVIGEEIEAVNIDREKLPRIVYRECSDDAPVPDVSKLSVGDLVSFGRFPEKEDYVMKPLQWRVLAVEDGKALMITEQEIIRLDLESTQHGVWADSPVRNLLNKGFYETSFSEKERAHILLSDINTPGNKKEKTDGGPNTKDRVFLLSMEEVEQYMPSENDRKSAPTAYAYSQGGPTRHEMGGCWHLRTPGKEGEEPVVVDRYGGFSTGSYYRDYIRPAVWIR